MSTTNDEHGISHTEKIYVHPMKELNFSHILSKAMDIIEGNQNDIFKPVDAWSFFRTVETIVEQYRNQLRAGMNETACNNSFLELEKLLSRGFQRTTRTVLLLVRMHVLHSFADHAGKSSLASESEPGSSSNSLDHSLSKSRTKPCVATCTAMDLQTSLIPYFDAQPSSKNILRNISALSSIHSLIIELFLQFRNLPAPIFNSSTYTPEIDRDAERGGSATSTPEIGSCSVAVVEHLQSALFYIIENLSYAVSLENDLHAVETACRLGDSSSITEILNMFPMLARVRNREHKTLLHTCCALLRQHVSDDTTAETISTNGANTKKHSGATDGVSSKHCPPTIKALLQFPFFINAVDGAGRSPLFYCTNAAAVAMLCERGADPNAIDELGTTPILQYVLSENFDCVQTILRFGADPTMTEPMKRRNAVHFAASLGHYWLMDVLYQNSEHEIDANQGDAMGNTALHLAAACQATESDPLKTLLLLLNNGADVRIANKRGLTVLHLVCCNPMLSSSLEPLVEMLLQKGANPNARDLEGCTPLLVACAYREFGVCKAILSSGGDMNIPCCMHGTFLSTGFADGDDFQQAAANYENAITSTDSAAGDVGDASAGASRKDGGSASQEKATITASDLLPRKPRYAVFSSISTLQSKIRSLHRDRCMNCGDYFAGDGPSPGLIGSLHLTTGRHHCRHCRRVVCPQCATLTLPTECMPQFVRDAYEKSEFLHRVCEICHAVLTDRFQQKQQELVQQQEQQSKQQQELSPKNKKGGLVGIMKYFSNSGETEAEITHNNTGISESSSITGGDGAVENSNSGAINSSDDGEGSVLTASADSPRKLFSLPFFNIHF